MITVFWCQGKINDFYVILQENDLTQADKYAEVAMSADRYNPAGED